MTDIPVKECRRRSEQANPLREPTLKVLQLLREQQIVQVIRLPRKSAKHILRVPVPQSDTGRRVEHTKALRDSWLRN